MGEFILTGSQQFGLRSGISQSLAGRVGLVQLLPFSMPELQVAGLLSENLDGLLWRGGYPLRPEFWSWLMETVRVECDAVRLQIRGWMCRSACRLAKSRHSRSHSIFGTTVSGFDFVAPPIIARQAGQKGRGAIIVRK